MTLVDESEILDYVSRHKPVPSELRNHLVSTYGDRARFRNRRSENMCMDDLLLGFLHRDVYVVVKGKLLPSAELSKAKINKEY